ncbi:MAG: GxxExxY protein [bacterium]
MKEPDEAIDELAHRVIGAAIEVHRILGPGFLESVYEEALCAELTIRSLSFKRQVPISIEYKGHCVGEGRIDLIIHDKIIIELKAVEAFAPIHMAQLLSYLRATGIQLGLLINFQAALLREGLKRIVLST